MLLKRGRMLRALALLVCCALLTGQVSAAFSDVPENAWYKSSMEYMTQRGLMNGEDEGRFAPGEALNRAMVLVVLARMSAAGGGSYPDAGYADVQPDMYYAEAVNWARSIRLIDGAETLGPTEPISRQELCVILWRYAKYMGIPVPEGEFVPFADQEAIHTDAVDACRRLGLVSGYPDGSFRPEGSLTRAEAAAILTRLGKLLEGTGWRVGRDPVDLSDWRLILVNPWNPVPEGYAQTIVLKNTPWNYEVDARIYDDLMDMAGAMWDAGLSPYINSAFRTNSYQRYLYNRKVSQYQGYGYSDSEAAWRAAQWVARPGTSEHEVGLAIDFNMDSSYSSTLVKNWLADNGWRYGFIYRYQAGKTDITGVNPEPWHFRYVGREYAKMIQESGLTLEEFLAQYR